MSSEPAQQQPDLVDIAVAAGEPDFDIDDIAEPKPTAAPIATLPPAQPLADALPIVAATPLPRTEPTPERTAELLSRIDALSKEARAVVAASPENGGVIAAPLWFEAGRLYEHELHNHREAAIHYQESHKANPAFLPVIHAARRLFGQLGKWPMVVMLLDEELKLPSANTPALIIEKARVHEAKLAKPDEAIVLYRSVLAHEPHNAIAVDAVTRALTASSAFRETVDVLVAAAQRATRDNLKAAWFLEAARLCETKLHDDARALDLVTQAEALVPNRRAVLEMMRRLAARRGDSARESEILERLADTSHNAIEAVAFLTEKARVDAAMTTDDAAGLKRAVTALEEARARAPEDTAILAELCRLYERLEMWSSLADCTEARALIATDKRERQAFTGDAARIAEERLGEHERAIRLYRAVVEIEPSDQLAMAALGRLFAKTRRFDDLSHMYDLQLESATEPAQKIPLLFKHAELLAGPMDDVGAALARLREILAISPGYVPASKMAAALSMKLERFQDLIEIWEAELKHNVDKDQSLYLLEKIAGTAEEKLDNYQAAIEAYQRMLKLQPGYLPALRSLGRLYAQQERWDDLIAINLEEAQTVSDQNVVVSLYFRNGEVLQDKLGRTDDAIAAYSQALQLMPTYLPALKALGAMYGKTGRYQELVAMHRAEAEVARTASQRAHLLYVAAELQETKVGDTDAAVAGYHEVLAEDATHHAALRALKRIATTRADAPMLLSILQGELKVTTDARDRAILRCSLADLFERTLQRTDDAVAALEEAIDTAPTLLAAHQALVSTLSRHNRASDEARARERMQQAMTDLDIDGKVANLRAIADLALHRLDDPARALAALDALLLLVDNDRTALRSSLGCALRLRDYRRATALAERLVIVEPDAAEVANLSLQLATWREGHLDPPEDPLPDYVRMLAFAPQHPIALRALERLYVERGAYEALFALYEREGKALTDTALIVDNAMKLGELAEHRLGKVDIAQACYEKAHAAQPDYLPAISRLKELYGKAGRPQDQLRLLSLEAQTSKDPAQAIRTLLEVGALQRDQFNDVDAAIDCYSRVLERDPHHAQAITALETLLTGAQRFAGLAKLAERRADATSGTNERAELLLRAAKLSAEHGDGDNAVRLYEKLVALQPQHPVALLAIGAAAFSRGDDERAISAYTAALPLQSDNVIRAAAHYELGVIFVERRPDAARAIEHLTACVQAQPEHRAARALLGRAYAASGQPAQAVHIYRQLLDVANTDDERREVHKTLAQLAVAVNEPTQAVTHLEQALALSKDAIEQAQIIEQLTGLYEATGNLQGLLDSTTKQAEAMAQAQPRRAAELHFRAARMAIERMNDVEQAVRYARRAMDLAPDVVEVRGFVADLYGRVPNQQGAAIEEHRRIIRGGRVRVASLKGLYRAFSSTRAHDRAFCAAEILSFLAAADDAEELFFSDNKKRIKKDSTEQLDAQKLTNWMAHPAQRNAVRDVLCAVAVDLGKPFAASDTEALDKKYILKPKAQDPLRSLADNMAHNLGAPVFDVWRSQVKKNGVDIVAGAPLAITVGLDVPRTHPNREQRFLIARKLMGLVSGHYLLKNLDGRGLATLLTAIGKNIDKNFAVLPGADLAESEATAKRIGGALSRKTRAAAQDALGQVLTQPRIDLDAYVKAVPFTENRMGLLLAGAFDAAARLVARDTGATLSGDTTAMVSAVESSPQLADLVSFAVSDEYFQARQVLRLAIDT